MSEQAGAASTNHSVQKPTLKLHRCSGTWVKGPASLLAGGEGPPGAGRGPRGGQAPAVPAWARKEYIAITGQNKLPALELADGKIVRDESKRLAERIRAREFSGG
jgi:hypothetical protein